jgi:YVTN family beta-propeller protein
MSLKNRAGFLGKTMFGVGVLASLVFFTVAKAEEDENDAEKSSSVSKSEYIPSGLKITPIAVPGAEFQLFNAGLKDFPTFSPNGAQTTVVSPDKKTLLVLLAGYNSQNGADGNIAPDAQSEYIFVYDISNGKPVQKQIIQLPNTFNGIAFGPNGKAFYVGGGSDDDVHSFELQASGTWVESGTPIKLGHATTNSLTPTGGVPSTAGLAITADGKRIVVANIYNDSISILDLAARTVTKEIDLRPGKLDPAQTGVPGGEYPYWVSIKGNDVAYISSLRDREIVVLNIGDKPGVISRIKIQGSPNKSILNRAHTRLYVTSEYEDVVSVIDTRSNHVIKTISTAGPDYITFHLSKYRGSAPTSLAFSPDEKVLYVTNTGTNSVAVIRLLSGDEDEAITGCRIPRRTRG